MPFFPDSSGFLVHDSHLTEVHGNMTSTTTSTTAASYSLITVNFGSECRNAAHSGISHTHSPLTNIGQLAESSTTHVTSPPNNSLSSDHLLGSNESSSSLTESSLNSLDVLLDLVNQLDTAIGETEPRLKLELIQLRTTFRWTEDAIRVVDGTPLGQTILTKYIAAIASSCCTLRVIIKAIATKRYTNAGRSIIQRWFNIIRRTICMALLEEPSTSSMVSPTDISKLQAAAQPLKMFLASLVIFKNDQTFIEITSKDSLRNSFSNCNPMCHTFHTLSKSRSIASLSTHTLAVIYCSPSRCAKVGGILNSYWPRHANTLMVTITSRTATTSF
ncbi:hypothetical protein HGRIS_004479 [Hohenbuehelia grisea]|uniref:Uncharacterized protein n=1 Tax=Hohenbuehelia grisea TaxID=104357 RepID=A0ABR3JCE1_9AGAR